jgi:hypothetical protein
MMGSAVREAEERAGAEEASAVAALTRPGPLNGARRLRPASARAYTRQAASPARETATPAATPTTVPAVSGRMVLGKHRVRRVCLTFTLLHSSLTPHPLVRAQGGQAAVHLCRQGFRHGPVVVVEAFGRGRRGRVMSFHFQHFHNLHLLAGRSKAAQ